MFGTEQGRQYCRLGFLARHRRHLGAPEIGQLTDKDTDILGRATYATPTRYVSQMQMRRRLLSTILRCTMMSPITVTLTALPSRLDPELDVFIEGTKSTMNGEALLSARLAESFGAASSLSREASTSLRAALCPPITRVRCPGK